jgi:hypothetical protein
MSLTVAPAGSSHRTPSGKVRSSRPTDPKWPRPQSAHGHELLSSRSHRPHRRQHHRLDPRGRTSAVATLRPRRRRDVTGPIAPNGRRAHRTEAPGQAHDTDVRASPRTR